MGGRGVGKTRSGAEDVAHFGLRNPDSRIAIVVPTFADGRDTCVEGESGLLAVIPKPYIKDWNRSLGELFLKNGSMYRVYTAETPNRLRGPQHHRTWCDEIGCLVGGTLVTTSDGPIPIEHIKPGMLVLTRKGWRPVVNAWCSHLSAPVLDIHFTNGAVIRGTGNHPVGQSGGFTRIDKLCKGDNVQCLMGNQQYPTWLSGTTGSGISQRGDTIKTVAVNCCTEQSTLESTGRYRQGGKYTTKTVTSSTTLRKITSKLYHLVSTLKSMLVNCAESLHSYLNNAQPLPANFGMSVNSSYLDVTSATRSIDHRVQGQNFVHRSVGRKICGGVDITGWLQRVNRATKNLLTLNMVDTIQNFVASLAPTDLCGTLEYGHIGCSHVCTVMNNFIGSTPDRSTVPQIASAQVLVPAKKVLGLWPVYDIEVDGCHEFFANGILVHNSWRYGSETWDMLQFGLRLGSFPRNIITTTPKPVQIVRDLLKAPHTIVVRESTYANRENLPPSFFEKIIAKYEGTRLGRQEIYAELLEDYPGSLWQRAWIDSHRMLVNPLEVAKSCMRIVVAIDPAVTSGEDADETGIAVCGADGNGQRGYVLADRSLRDTPRAWAMAAVSAYKEFGADCIIGEANNGGDLVEENIRMIDPNVPFQKVNASRGKYVRAEPISSLYEQGRIWHVGAFDAMEDQMCMFTPDNVAKNSPDRAEAAVWAFTELFDGNFTFGVLEVQKQEMEEMKIARSQLSKPATSPKSKVCPACKSVAVTLIGGALHCNQCGHTAGGGPTLEIPNRANISKYIN